MVFLPIVYFWLCLQVNYMQDGIFSHICTKKNATVKWIFAEDSVIFYKFSLYFKVLFLHFIPSNFAL